MLLLSSLVILSGLGTFVKAQHGAQNCANYRDAVIATNKTIQANFNTTIFDVSYVPAGSSLNTPGSCQSTANVTAAVCRVQAVVNTSATSAVHFEAWLPDQWYGRFLSLGNGGLGGCIDYANLDYGSNLHFATVASDNGHDGTSGAPFLNHPEVIIDFAFRAVHNMTVIGKDIVGKYYGLPHHKAYYLGCSQGGRQGMQSALLFPDDFDGIMAGAPAVDHNHLLGWLAMLGRFIGAPTANPVIPPALWPVISEEILHQCDKLDSVEDGIITDPDRCNFRPEALLCHAGNTTNCLNATQVSALHHIYSPLLGTHGQLLFPKYDLAAEADGQWKNTFTGDIISLSQDWFKYTIFNNSAYTFENFSVKDIEFADTINPGGIATWNGDFSAFRKRGGKVLTYHGRRDQIIASDNSLRLYNLIRSTLSLPSLDDFYRLFLIPGMQHCSLGPGAWMIGQGAGTANDTAHNALLALVDWVEGGHAPKEIVGSTPVTGVERTHCRYPHASVFDGKNYVCR